MIWQPRALSGKLQHVQAMRALAALMVVIFHCMLNSVQYFNVRPVLTTIWQFGWVGVEFFFILSGFIITYIHLHDVETATGVLNFLRKRFVRIYPIFWVVATVMLIYYLFIKKGGEGTTVDLNGLNDVVYLLRCYLLLPMGALRKNFIDIAWTLNYEVFFYVVFAVFIRLGLRKSRYVYFSWALLILAKHYLFPRGLSAIVDFMFNPIILYFLSGCLVAYLLKKKKVFLSVKTFALIFSIAALLLFFYVFITQSVPDQKRADINYNYFLISLLGMILWRAAITDTLAGTSSVPGSLLLIGDASYSLYLIHPPVIMLCYKSAAYLTGKYQISISTAAANIIFVITILICVTAGILLHLLIEKPLLDALNKTRNVRRQKLELV